MNKSHESRRKDGIITERSTKCMVYIWYGVYTVGVIHLCDPPFFVKLFPQCMDCLEFIPSSCGCTLIFSISSCAVQNAIRNRIPPLMRNKNEASFIINHVVSWNFHSNDHVIIHSHQLPILLDVNVMIKGIRNMKTDMIITKKN